MRQLGIPTVVGLLVRQAINQVLTIIYEPQFSARSYGFCPRRGCLNALREVQKTVDEGYRYVVDLERFFDTVSYSKLIEILSRTIKDGRVVSLIHKYLRSGAIDKGLWHASEEGTLRGGAQPAAQQHHAERVGQGTRTQRTFLCTICRRFDDILQDQACSRTCARVDNFLQNLEAHAEGLGQG